MINSILNGDEIQIRTFRTRRSSRQPATASSTVSRRFITLTTFIASKSTVVCHHLLFLSRTNWEVIIIAINLENLHFFFTNVRSDLGPILSSSLNIAHSRSTKQFHVSRDSHIHCLPASSFCKLMPNFYFFKQFLYQAICTQRTPKGPE